MPTVMKNHGWHFYKTECFINREAGLEARWPYPG